MELPIVDTEGDEAEGLAIGHEHHWRILAIELTQLPVMFTSSRPATLVLLRCRDCGWPQTTMLAGYWTREQLGGEP